MSLNAYLNARAESVMKSERYERHTDEELKRARRRNMAGYLGGSLGGGAALVGGAALHDQGSLNRNRARFSRALEGPSAEGKKLFRSGTKMRVGGKVAMGAGGAAMLGSLVPAMRYQHAYEETGARRVARRVKGQ